MTSPPKEALLCKRLGIGAALSVVALVICEASNRWVPLPDRQTRMAAATRMASCEAALAAEKRSRGVPVRVQDDPAGTGLIGPPHSAIVTDNSTVEVKRTAANPNLAAAVVRLLSDLGVGPGDPVAISMTGSMPGANLAVLTATEAIGARAAVVVSVGPSMWGASDPEFTWLDMEAALRAKGLLRTMPLFATPGGQADNARGLPAEAVKLMRASADRNGTRLVRPVTVAQAVELRLSAFRQALGGPPKAFVNVGGGAASYGTAFNATIAPGPVIQPDFASTLEPSGVMYEMLSTGVPVINLHQMTDVARSLGLPLDYVEQAPLGEPKSLYAAKRRPLTVLVPVTVVLVLALVLLLRIGGVVPLAVTREVVSGAAETLDEPKDVRP